MPIYVARIPAAPFTHAIRSPFGLGKPGLGFACVTAVYVTAWQSVPFSVGDYDTMPKITATRFVIAVPNLQSSAAFYRDVLGFTIHSIPDPRFLLYISGDCTIWAAECADALHPSQLGDHSYFAYLQIDDIDSFYGSVCAAGARICKAIRDEPWGMREFGLVTADGHRIMFASPVADATSVA